MAALRREGHEVALFFESGDGDVELKLPLLGPLRRLAGSRRRLLSEAIAFEPDLIAFSCLSNMFSWVKELSAEFRRLFPEVPQITGGVHATQLPTAVLKQTCSDFICRGEGERCITELTRLLEAHPTAGPENYSRQLKAVLKDVPNLGWLDEDGQYQQNQVESLKDDLNWLPWPYKEPFFRYGTFSQRLYVMAGRGCPYKCTYCFNPSYHDLYDRQSWVRFRNVKHVIDELKHFLELYPYKEIFFYDDIFTLNRQWLREFAAAYQKEIGLPYKCLIRPDCFNEETARLLAESGCKYVDLGLESGDEELRRTMLKRRMTDQTIIETCTLLRKYKIKFTTLNIIGVPGETRASLWATLRLNRKIRPDGIIVSTFYPFAGTPLYETCLKEGLLDQAGRQMVEQGLGSYKGRTILNHPLADELERWQTFLPLAIRLPEFMSAALLKLPPLGIFRLISIFFLSVPSNLWLRLKEFGQMYIRSNFSRGRLSVQTGERS